MQTADDVKANIEMIEREYGSKDDLEKELTERLEKFNKVNDFATNLKKTCEVIIFPNKQNKEGKIR